MNWFKVDLVLNPADFHTGYITAHYFRNIQIINTKNAEYERVRKII